MPYQITGERLTSLFRPRSVALVGASDKSAFSQIAYHTLVQFGFREHTYLVSRSPVMWSGMITSSLYLRWTSKEAAAPRPGLIDPGRPGTYVP